MIEEGAQAPTFELPGIRGGEFEQIDAEAAFGGGIVVLAFYPGDFNPACSGTETDLDELDLFTMQKDVTVLAISGDSVHSHRAFAEEYNLEMALLSDLRGEVARKYGVAVTEETAGHLTKRAVFVVDHTGTVQYAWATDDCEELPDVDEIRDTVQGIGDDDTAQSRYRIGHAHYMEGRRSFTSAMNAYENREWMMAQTDFAQAAEEFDEALEEFNTAVRFSESETSQTYFERAEEKSEALWRASEWLSESAGAFASGSGRKAESLRSDAEGPLETVRELHEPPEPDDFPPEEDPAERDEEEEPDRSWLHEDDDIDTSLDADFDAELDGEEADEVETTADGEAAEGPVEASESEAVDDETEETAEDDESTEIDDAELEEITAELEEKTEAAQEETEETEPEPGGGNVVPQGLDDGSTGDGSTPDHGDSVAESSVAGATGAGSDGPVTGDAGQPQQTDGRSPTADEATDGDAADTTSQEQPPDVEGGDGEDIELDLTDPTEGDDEGEKNEEGDEGEEEDETGDEAEDEDGDGEQAVSDETLGSGGDHGVPDSL